MGHLIKHEITCDFEGCDRPHTSAHMRITECSQYCDLPGGWVRITPQLVSYPPAIYCPAHPINIGNIYDVTARTIHINEGTIPHIVERWTEEDGCEEVAEEI